jgi:lipopolysaccharide export system protein LptA
VVTYDASGNITIGNGSTKRTTEIADVTRKYESKGKMDQVRIEDFPVLKNGSFNLFGTSQVVRKGWKVEGDKEKVVIKKGDLKIKFDIKSRHQKLCCLQQKSSEKGNETVKKCIVITRSTILSNQFQSCIAHSIARSEIPRVV